MKKKILAVALAATMVIGSAFSAFAADTLVGDATTWWTTTNTSTAVTLEDGATVSWEVTVVANDGQADGDWAAFLIEATDGTNYCSAGSNGDIWGAGTDTDDTEDADVSFGNTYTASITRDGNNFTVKITGDDADMEMYLEGTSEFGDTTCYVMSQVGDLTVSDATTSTASDSSDDDDATTTAASDDADDADDADEATTTAADDSTETGDVATVATVAIVLAAAAAIVVLKKRVTE